ncbi:MAG: fatty acid desaturase, partial [Acidithiobacillus ferrivorans]
MPLTSSGADYKALHPIKLQTIREAIRPERYQRSAATAIAWYGFDALLYLSAIAGALLVETWWLKLLFGLLAGSAVAFMFVWAHDAAHGALFQSKRTAEIMGTIFMLPSLNMYRLWAFGHNRVHHGFTSLTTVDWVWRPWTPQEYRSKTVWQKMIYRLERSPYTCALHYLLRIWWPGMVRFKADAKSKDRRAFFYSKIVTLVFFLSFSALAYWIAGMMGVIAA